MVRNTPASVGDPGLVPGSGGSPGGGHGYPLQHSCLENPMDRGAGRATLHGVAVRHDGAPESRLSRCVLEKRPPAHGGLRVPAGRGLCPLWWFCPGFRLVLPPLPVSPLAPSRCAPHICLLLEPFINRDHPSLSLVTCLVCFV